MLAKQDNMQSLTKWLRYLNGAYLMGLSNESLERSCVTANRFDIDVRTYRREVGREVVRRLDRRDMSHNGHIRYSGLNRYINGGGKNGERFHSRTEGTSDDM